VTADHLWSWLLTPPSLAKVIDPFAVAYGVVFIAGFVLSVYLAGPGGMALRARVNASIDLERWTKLGTAIFGAGLVFLGARLLQINPLGFGAPVWMVAATLALLVAAVRFVRAWRTAREAHASDSVDRPLECAEARSA
jgi:hypothetical protein